MDRPCCGISSRLSLLFLIKQSFKIIYFLEKLTLKLMLSSWQSGDTATVKVEVTDISLNAVEFLLVDEQRNYW